MPKKVKKRLRVFNRKKLILSGIAGVSLILILILGLMLVNMISGIDHTPEEPDIGLDTITIQATPEPEQTPEPTQTIDPETKLNDDISGILRYISLSSDVPPITDDFIRYHNENTDPHFAEKLKNKLDEEAFDKGIFYELFGSSLFVLYDQYEQTDESHIISASKLQEPGVLAFAGDINLADTWVTMQYLSKQTNGLNDCISQPLTERLRAADILLINNEFAFSDRGAPMKGKSYTFRAKTENVKYLLEMGVDIVGLANNHVFDYGEDAFYDTLDTLEKAGIAYVGAGRNISEAMDPQYYIISGVKVAYVAASRAEKNIMTPEAKENKPGVLRTYDSALFLEKVRNAKSNADIVIAYVHWGTEYSYVLEKNQTKLARDLIDNGADLVIGAHPHILQGIEYYNGKPVVYSLGNLWFNEKTLDTALLEVTINSPDDIILTIRPCLQKDKKTSLLTDESDRKRVFELLMSISPDRKVLIDDNGAVSAIE